MALQIITSTIVGPGAGVDLGTTDDLFLTSAGLIGSTGSAGVFSYSGDHSVTIAGEIWAKANGIQLGTSVADNNNQVVVLAGGSVVSADYNGAYIQGQGSRVENHGEISGLSGVGVVGDNAIVLNYGHISCTGTGSFDSAVEISQYSATPETAAMLINFGTIYSPRIAVLGDYYNNDDIVKNFGTITGDIFQSGGDDRLLNRGLIVGNIDAGAGLDLIDNRGGTIEGDVLLGTENDRYVGTGGTINGAVYGDAGADTFFGNQNSAEVFVGGADVDTLDFRLGGQVTLALDLSFAQNGAALGDTYFEMENVFGSDVGNDVIRGNPAANALFGWGGNDSLDGAGGADVLRGGTGVDTLTGGTGDDTFRFSALTECGDLITDFAGNLGNNDRFQITAAAFGGGLVAGVLAANQFITRADNLAQDADDRFIFNTTDRTLWFDADGNGAGAAVMVADLQAGAVVTAADILLI